MKENPKSLSKRGELNPMWKGDEVSPKNARSRAQRWFAASACEQCGAEKVERHHKDGDPLNNDPENIAMLCRRCHMIADGRMERWVALGESRSKTKQANPRPWRA